MKRSVAALCLVWLPGLLAAQEPVPRFEVLPDGAPFPISVPASFRSTVGFLVVAENREAAASATIKLPVAIIHGASEDTLGPVLYLSGGPGTSAMSAAEYPGAYPWTKDRDFVVLGQRGTHHAVPALMCPEYRDGLGGVSQSDQSGALRRQVRDASACRERLEIEGVDLAGYHTAATARDAEDLRRLLSARPWTVYAVSYGTRVALAMARDHAGGVRAMVLDSPLPPHVRYDDESAGNLKEALQSVAADCSAQEPCRRAYPSLWDRFVRVVRPLAVRSDNPASRAGVRDLVRRLDLGSSEAIRSVPAQMDAIAKGAVPGGESRALPASDFAWGMRMSVWCAEALPFTRRVGSEPRESFAGLESAVVPPEVCEAWGVPARPETEAQAVATRVPALLLAGEFDALTPPKWAYSAAESLGQSAVVIIRGGGHGVSQEWGGDGCAMLLAAGFIADPEAALKEFALAKTCASARPGPQYLVPDGN